MLNVEIVCPVNYCFLTTARIATFPTVLYEEGCSHLKVHKITVGQWCVVNNRFVTAGLLYIAVFRTMRLSSIKVLFSPETAYNHNRALVLSLEIIVL